MELLRSNSEFKTANSLLYKELAKNGKKNIVFVTHYDIRSYSLNSELLTFTNPQDKRKGGIRGRLK
jgi:hypothetical protein